MILNIKTYEVLIDDEDADLVATYKWSVAIKRGVPYFQSTSKPSIQLARLILSAPAEFLVDHINGNTLDNRKSNLRLATKRTNAQNMKSNRGSTSKYKGVCWDKFRNKWRATIKVDGKQVHLGRFLTEEDAAKMYDKKAKEFFKEFARTNF